MDLNCSLRFGDRKFSELRTLNPGQIREDIMVEEKVKEILEKLRPVLQRDGGDISFVGIKDNIVKVKLQGACGSCPMSQMTLKTVVEQTIKKEITEIESVEAV